MTSTSSLMAAAPLLCSPSAKPRHDSAARPGVLLARPLPNPRRSRPLGQRWMHGGARVKPQANTRLFYSWKQHNHRIDRKDALGFPTEQPGSLACFCSRQCCRGHMRRQATGMFQNKLTFSIHRHPFWSSTGTSVLIPYATLGPDEPHVAGTAWSVTALEKQGSGFWSSEAEKTEVERILSYPLPPHSKLHRGQLKNGLRYIILPNKIPADRLDPKYQ